MRTIAIVLLLCTGCAPREAAAWVPALTVHGQLVQRESAYDWRIGAALTLRDRDTVVRDAPYPEVEYAHTPAACAQPTLCAWERRANAEALRRLGRGE